MSAILKDTILTTHRRLFMAGFAVVCLAGVPACAPLTKDDASAPIASQQPPPPSSYPEQPAVSAPPDDGVLKRVPGSDAALTRHLPESRSRACHARARYIACRGRKRWPHGEGLRGKKWMFIHKTKLSVLR